MLLLLILIFISLFGLLLFRIYLFLFYALYNRLVLKAEHFNQKWAMFPRHFRQNVGLVGTLILMLPPVIVVMPLVGELIFDTHKGPVEFIKYILSDGRFDPSLAGFVLDRPTIGKGLFWFTVDTILSIPYIAIAGWASNRNRLSTNVAYCLAVIYVCVVLLCTLMLPTKWLLQYVHDMGYTPARIFGLIYCFVGGCFVLGFLWWVLRRPKVRGGELELRG